MTRPVRRSPTPPSRSQATCSRLGRTVQTGDNGLFQFQDLTPGQYLVEIDKVGVGRAKRAAIVEVGKDTQVDFVLGLTSRKK